MNQQKNLFRIRVQTIRIPTKRYFMRGKITDTEDENDFELSIYLFARSNNLNFNIF